MKSDEPPGRTQQADVVGHPPPEAESEESDAIGLGATANLMRLLGVATHNAKTLEQVFENALAEICRHMAWPVGFAYIVDAQHRLKKLTSWYRSNPERYMKLERVSARISFDSTSSLIGRVLSTRKRAIFRT